MHGMFTIETFLMVDIGPVSGKMMFYIVFLFGGWRNSEILHSAKVIKMLA